MASRYQIPRYLDTEPTRRPKEEYQCSINNVKTHRSVLVKVTVLYPVLLFYMKRNVQETKPVLPFRTVFHETPLKGHLKDIVSIQYTNEVNFLSGPFVHRPKK